MTEERIHEPALAVRHTGAEPADVPAERLVRPAQHPLGPRVTILATRRPGRARLWAGMTLAGSVGLLSVAAWLSPDPSGVGSHRQLGFPACTSIALTGYPCPTCGMTTAFAHAVRGQLISAFLAQPAGLLLALSTMAAGIISAFVVLTGLVPSVNWYRISPTWVVLVVAAAILLGWLFKLAAGWMTGSLPIA